MENITQNTHIVGLCGANDYTYSPISANVAPKHASDPSIDGWMVSDFYLLHHLFRGVGSTQNWLTCLDPQELIRRHGEYAHGNPYRPRQVALDSHQLPDASTLQVVAPEQLLTKFLEVFRTVCRAARKKEEPVLLCLFAHGDDLTYGVEIGGIEKDGPLLYTADIAKIVSENAGLDLCVLLTSCFSGGWVTVSDFKDSSARSTATIATAAGPTVQSESWPQSTSLGRVCGSIYVSALLNVLESEGARATVDDQSTTMSTEEFARAITSELLDVLDPRFGTQHDHRFEVQGNQWSDPYPLRTGIPRSGYHAKLKELRTIPGRPLADIRKDRSRTNEEVDKWDLANPTASHAVMAASNYGGSMRAVKRAITKKAIQYINTSPGRDSLANNHHAHALIRQCINNPESLIEDAWSEIWELLHYRMGVVSLVEKLIAVLGLKAPKPGKWDYQQWLNDASKTKKYEFASVCYRMILKANLIPAPHGSRKRYDKPIWCLAVALTESGLSKAEAEEKISIARQGEIPALKRLRQVVLLTLHQLFGIRWRIASVL